MPTVSKTRLKAHMLAYFREVEATGEPLVVTDRGLPVLQVAPVVPRRSVDEVFADWRAQTPDIDDDALMAPTTDEWPQVAG